VRPRTRCELSELLLANRAGAWVTLAAGLSLYGRDPLALRPAVTGGLPFAEILDDLASKNGAEL